MLADPVHMFSLPVLLQVDHHEQDVTVAGDEDVLVLHLDVVQLLKGVFEESSHGSYRAAHLEGLESRCFLLQSEIKNSGKADHVFSQVRGELEENPFKRISVIIDAYVVKINLEISFRSSKVSCVIILPEYL